MTRGVEWAVRAVAVIAVAIVGWALITGWGAIVHGFPLYGPLLLITLVVAIVVLLRTFRRRGRRTRRWSAIRIGLLVPATLWIAVLAWLRPLSAVEPALAAMLPDRAATVTETPTRIMITPAGTADNTALFFQPGAKVDARAYAAVLRPVAEAGHPVVIVKQPLNIAFLAVSAFEQTRDDHPEIGRWVVGGHSLGGTVAAIQADAGDDEPKAPVAGLILFASYPADDLSSSLTAEVLSLSASNDGLATPAKITASAANLPAATTFTVVDGAVHSFFGDYGPQRGDGVPTISQQQARDQISADTVDFISGLQAE